MGIADGFVLYRPQAESLDRIVGRLLEPAVVESQSLSLAILEEQFAVIGAVEPAPDELTHFAAVKPGAVEKGGGE